MAFSLFRILKGLRIVQEGTLTPKEVEITPGGSAGTKTTIVTSQTSNQTITVPDATDTLMGKATTDVMTNKTFDADGTGNSITNIENADIKAGANIARNKLASGNANRVIVNDGTGVLSDAAAITANKALASDANGIPVASATTDTELGYVSGVTSSIQTQLNTKAADASVVHLAGSETVTGSKTFTAAQIFENILRGDVVDDAASTGSSAAVPAPAKMAVRLTNASLVSINTITSPANNQFLVLINDTGNSVTVLNSTTASTSEIYTGTGSDLAMLNNASLWLYYDATETKWRVIGGSSGGSSFQDSLFQIYDDGDITKIAKFQVSGISTGTTRTFTLPDANTTLVGTDATQTLTNKTVSTTSNNVTATASRAAQFNGSGNLEASTVTSTELGYVSGVTSAIQTQLNNKASTTLNNLGVTAVNADIDPDTTDVRDLGSGSLRWNSITANTVDTLTVGRFANPLAMQGNSFSLGGAPIVNVDRAELVNKASDPSTPSSGFTAVYSKSSDKQVYIKDDTGAVYKLSNTEKDSINYIGNALAENNTTGWSTYADAAGASPVDGTGGSPTETWTRSTSSPLRGAASFLLTKDAANRQGEGVSYAFTIDSADQSKVLGISFDYSIASGTYSGGTSSTDSDLVVYVYDVTNAAVIQPAPHKLDGAVVGNQYKFKGEFQAASNSTSYRLIIHTATTSASAYTVKFDNFVVSPNTSVQGTISTDWSTTSTITIGAVTTAPTKGTVATDTVKWKRIGDTAIIEYHYRQSAAGTAGSGEYLFSLPAGLAFDSSIPLYTTTASNVDHSALMASLVGYGHIARGTGGGARGQASCFAYSSTQFRVGAINAFTAYQMVGSGIYALDADQGYAFTIIAKISGWGSNTLASNDADTRVIAARYRLSANTAFTSSQNVNYDTKVFDTHNAVTTGSSWVFTAPVSGYYRVSSYDQLTTAASSKFDVYKNGSFDSTLGDNNSNGGSGSSGSVIVSCNAGDTIAIRGTNASYTLVGGSSSTSGAAWISIERLTGPSQIAASETIAARVSASSGTSVANNTVVGLNMNSTTFDTHGGISTVSSITRFTAPSRGYYQVNAAINLGTGISPNSGTGQMYIYKNGSQYSGVNTMEFATTTNAWGVAGSDIVQLNAGDYVEIRVKQTTGTTLTSSTDGTTYWTVNRIGI